MGLPHRRQATPFTKLSTITTRLLAHRMAAWLYGVCIHFRCVLVHFTTLCANRQYADLLLFKKFLYMVFAMWSAYLYNEILMHITTPTQHESYCIVRSTVSNRLHAHKNIVCSFRMFIYTEIVVVLKMIRIS